MKIATKRVEKGAWWAEIYEEMPEAVSARIRKLRARASVITEVSGPEEIKAKAKEHPDVWEDFVQGIREARITYGVKAWCWDVPLNNVGVLPGNFVEWLADEIAVAWTEPGDDLPSEKKEKAAEELKKD